MSRQESVERRAKNEERGKEYRLPKMWFWACDEFAPFVARIAEIGMDNIERFEAWPGVDENGEEDLHRRILVKGQKWDEVRPENEFNFSHPCCPLNCPPDMPPC